MSGPPPQLPPPSNPRLLPVLAAVVYLAAVVAYWGLLSLALDREVVDYPDAGPLLGPAMAVAAGAVTWLALWRTRRSRSPWAGAVLAAVGSLAAMLLVAVVGYAPVAGAHFALSPFILGAAGLSGLTVVAAWALRPRRTI